MGNREVQSGLRTRNRERQTYQLGYLLARSAMEAPYPDDILFIERSVYEYELPLEYGICCYWTGRQEEAIRVNEAIIATPDVPVNFLETARKNRQFSLEALPAANTAKSPSEKGLCPASDLG